MNRLNIRFFAIVLLLFATLSCGAREREIKLVILHTNDSHSQIEPINAGAGKGFGGVSRRAQYFEQVKRENSNVLILDAGDYNQGTPFFTLFKGDLEMELMNVLGYEVATLGNHEFDNGQEELARRLAKAKFPTICANLDLSNSPLKPYVKPYVIVKKGGLKIGIIGLSVNLSTLVGYSARKGIEFLDPVEITNRYAELLKTKEKCDLVIVLSHLGYSYQNSSTPSDINLAPQTENVDIIIGGHTHTFLKSEVLIPNKQGKDVIVLQAGAKGEYVGRLDLTIKKK